MSSTQTTSVIIKLINIIKALKKLNENEFESEQCLEYLRKIDNSFNEEKQSRVEIAKVIIEYGYVDVALRCLRFYTRKNFLENEQTWPCTFYLLRSIWNYSDVLPEIGVAASGFIPILLEFISCEFILPSEEEEEKLLKLTLNILNNIAHQPENKVVFQQYQASKILKKISNIESEHLKVLVYLILAQIVNENEFDKLNDPTNEVIENLISYIRDSLKKDHRYKGISTGEYMDSLARLAVTKENKQKIVDIGAIQILKSILAGHHNNEEINNALICVWNLSFDEKICELIKKDKDLLSQITNIKNSTTSDEMQRRASGILFTLNDFTSKRMANSSFKENNKKQQQQHIMISYNCGSREMCMKIREELKARGYQVWIDVEQIYGSSLQSMAEAVENCFVFLMCVSEKYYLSPNCRLEAEYAVRLQKPIIPLIMQPDYMPLGWLGIIVGGKIYYKFAGKQSSFEQTFASMVKEIGRHVSDESKTKQRPPLPEATNKQLSTSNENLLKQPQQQPQQQQQQNGKYVTVMKPVADWSTRDVKQWIQSMNLSSWITDSDLFENINGGLLRELSDIKRTAPEFFFSLIKNKLTSLNGQQFQLYDLLKLTHELDELFKR